MLKHPPLPPIARKMEPLNFKSIEVFGYDRMEPPAFDINVKKYTIYRKSGSNLCFRAELNRAPVPKTEENGWNHQPYPGFTHEMHASGDVYKSFWSPGDWKAITAGPDETEVCISCDLGKRARLEGEKTFYISLTVHTEPLTQEERKACTHPSTRTTEGEFWGGGSGSCTVEMITSCTVCGATTNTYHEHRD